MTSRRLRLRRESLNELTSADMAEVAGGSVHTFCTGCETICQGDCPSLDRCPTTPMRYCLSLSPYVCWS